MYYGCAVSTITIKDVPWALHRTLKARAAANRRSLNQEVIMTLEGSLHGSCLDATAIGTHARSVRETLGVYMTQKDLAALKDAGRR